MDRLKLFLLIITLSYTVSCVKYDEAIKTEYRSQLDIFDIDKILVFESMNDLDSIRISGIDSTSTTQGPSNLPMKSITLRIRHIPNHKWHNGIKLSESGNYDSISDQNFLSVHKMQRNNNSIDDDYGLSVEYRDFSGVIDLEKLKRKKTDTIITELGKVRDKFNDSSVIAIYWNIDKGLIGYRKKSGSEYKLITE